MRNAVGEQRRALEADLGVEVLVGHERTAGLLGSGQIDGLAWVVGAVPWSCGSLLEPMYFRWLT